MLIYIILAMFVVLTPEHLLLESAEHFSEDSVDLKEGRRHLHGCFIPLSDSHSSSTPVRVQHLRNDQGQIEKHRFRLTQAQGRNYVFQKDISFEGPIVSDVELRRAVGGWSMLRDSHYRAALADRRVWWVLTEVPRADIQGFPMLIWKKVGVIIIDPAD